MAVSDVNVVNFLPVLMDEYFHYHGSLTTGGCEESVNWVVFKNSIAIRVNNIPPKQQKTSIYLLFAGVASAGFSIVEE